MERQNIFPLLKQQGLSAPETLTLAITGTCNLRCAHCWVDAGLNASATWVPTLTVKQLIADFAAIGGAAIRLTGGEPLLHPDWLDLLAAAGAAGLKVMLQTNGILFTADNLQEMQALKLAELRIQISLDGATAASHDLVRGPGAYDQTLQGILLLIDSGFAPALDLFFTEMKHNLHELPDLLLLAEQLGVGSVSSGCLVACGRANQAVRIAPPDAEQYQALLQRYASDPQFRRCYEQLGSIAALEWCTAETTRQGCSFISNPYLTAKGILYPCLLCHADEYSVSGVFEKGLLKSLLEGEPLWSNLQRISQQRIVTLEACQDCDLVKSCAGGCMGRAWGSFGAFMQVEDRCQQRQVVMRWKEKNPHIR